MKNPQAGIFALGTSSHAYLEFDAVDGRHGRDLVSEICSLREPRTTMGGLKMLTSMVETPDALMHYTHPLTGAYYFVPSIESLLEVSGQGA